MQCVEICKIGSWPAVRQNIISSQSNNLQLLGSCKDYHWSCDFSGGEDGEHEELPLLVGHPALVGQPHRGVRSRRK